MKYLIFPILLVFLGSCAKTKSDADAATNIRGGRCLLSKNGSNYLCIDFNEDSDSNTNSDTCTDEYDRYEALADLSGISSMSGNANTCATATTATVVGTCTRTDGVINYYDVYFDATSAQADCTSIHSGTWAP